jgi:predicted GNAT family N-acyltransferase
VRLLSERFIDEARTRAFYESGTWSARAKEQMYYKAARQMRHRCVTPQTLKQAETNARAELTALFQTFGFTRVGIDFDDL